MLGHVEPRDVAARGDDDRSRGRRRPWSRRRSRARRRRAGRSRAPAAGRPRAAAPPPACAGRPSGRSRCPARGGSSAPARAPAGAPATGAAARPAARGRGGTRPGDRAPRPRRGRGRRPSCPPRGSRRRRARPRRPRSGARSPGPAAAARARRTRPRRPARACPPRRATRRARPRRARSSSRRRARPATRRRGRSHRRRRPRRRSSLKLPLLLLASLRRHDPDQVRRSAPRWRPLSPIAGSRVLRSWYPLGGDPSRAPRHRPPLPRVPGARARVDRGRGARRRRSDPAARQGARRRGAGRGGGGVPRPRRAVHPQRPPGPGGGVRRRRRARRPGRRSPAAARALVGPDRIVGRSTHAPDQAAAADADPDVDYFAVGPVHATPTKPGRAPRAWTTCPRRSRSEKPWFAIGGLDAGNVHEVVERGATRIVVVRAITDADDPEAAARALRAALGDALRALSPRDGAGRGARPRTTPDASPPPGGDAERGYARSRAKADAIRAGLEPLGPDERPLGLKLAIALALFVAVANLIGAAAGVGGESPALGIVFALFMGAVAYGLWQRSYVVILLFQALLALTIIVFTLSLAFAGNLLACCCAVGIASARRSSGCSCASWRGCRCRRGDAGRGDRHHRGGVRGGRREHDRRLRLADHLPDAARRRLLAGGGERVQHRRARAGRGQQRDRLPARAARPVAAGADPRLRHDGRRAARRHPAAHAAGRGVRRDRPVADPARLRADGDQAHAVAARGRRAHRPRAPPRRSSPASTAATSAPPRGSSRCRCCASASTTTCSA